MLVIQPDGIKLAEQSRGIQACHWIINGATVCPVPFALTRTM